MLKTKISLYWGFLAFFFPGKFKTDLVQGWVDELEKLRKQPGSLHKFSSPRRTLRTHDTVQKDLATVRPFSVDQKEKSS